MASILVKCEICYTDFARIEEEDIKPPLHGNLFRPIHEGRGMANPFLWDAPWVDLRCPVCKKRPFINPNRIMDHKREYHGYSFECPQCHEFFKNAQALAGHKNKHRS